MILCLLGIIWFPLIKLAKKLKVTLLDLCGVKGCEFPLIKLAKKLKASGTGIAGSDWTCFH